MSLINAFKIRSVAAGLFLPASAACGWQDPVAAKSESRGIVREVDALPEFVADRPDFTDSTVLIRPGVIQVEMGTTLDREGSTVSQGEMLMRTGLTRRIEIRFGGMLSETSTPGGFRRGASNAETGVKVRLWEERRRLPAVSVIANLSKTSGDSDTPGGGYEPTVKLAWSKDLKRGFTLGSNFNVSSLRLASGRITQHAQSASLGHELPAGFVGYWEIFRASPWDDGTGVAWVFNTGVSHRVGRNAQFDLRVGKRLTDAGPNWFFGGGFAFRQPMGLFAR